MPFDSASSSTVPEAALIEDWRGDALTVASQTSVLHLVVAQEYRLLNMSLEPLTSATSSSPSPAALRALARVAGDGELQAQAVRRLEESRAALEISGWLPLQELQLGAVRIRHALVGPAGVAVAIAGGLDPDYNDLAEVDRQARALAQLLGLDRDAVLAIVAIMGSLAAPAKHVYPDASGVVIGDKLLADWLAERPVVIDADGLDALREAIFASAAKAAEAKPKLRLPTVPSWG